MKAIYIDKGRVKGPDGTIMAPSNPYFCRLLELVGEGNTVKLEGQIKKLYKQLVKATKLEAVSLSTQRLTEEFEYGAWSDADDLMVNSLSDRVFSGQYIAPFEFCEPHPNTYEARLVYKLGYLQQPAPIARNILVIPQGFIVVYTIHFVCYGQTEIGATDAVSHPEP